MDSDGVHGVSATDIIEYQIDLINTGTTTLRDVVISDPILTEQLQRWERRFHIYSCPVFRCSREEDDRVEDKAYVWRKAVGCLPTGPDNIEAILTLSILPYGQ